MSARYHDAPPVECGKVWIAANAVGAIKNRMGRIGEVENRNAPLAPSRQNNPTAIAARYAVKLAI